MSPFEESAVAVALKLLDRASSRIEDSVEAFDKDDCERANELVSQAYAQLRGAIEALRNGQALHAEALELERVIAKAKLDLMTKADTEPPPSGERKAG